jgi:hypothetical protein
VEILKSLETSPVVERHHVLDFRRFEDGWYYKIEVALVDGSVLHAREYAGEDARRYSYHWQDARDNLLIRWDNAPHHEQVSTYPHHKHVAGTV